jgi:hypothetical protein
MIRDIHSKALIETDYAELQKYRNTKRHEKELTKLKTDVQSIKEGINNLYSKIKEIENKI